MQRNDAWRNWQRNDAWRNWLDNARAALASATDAPAYWAAHKPVTMRGLVDWPTANWSIAALKAYGSLPVEVQVNRLDDADYEVNSDKHRGRMTMLEFLDAVERGAANSIYMTAQNAGSNIALKPLFDKLRPLPNMLSEHAWGEFLWIGKGTRTPLHHDLAQILMVQLHGEKTVWLVDPVEQPELKNNRGVHSDFRWLSPDNGDWFGAEIVTLAPGDALFIPVGWWHQVETPDYSATATFTNFRWPNDWSQGFPQ